MPHFPAPSQNLVGSLGTEGASVREGRDHRRKTGMLRMRNPYRAPAGGVSGSGLSFDFVLNSVTGNKCGREYHSVASYKVGRPSLCSGPNLIRHIRLRVYGLWLGEFFCQTLHCSKYSTLSEEPICHGFRRVCGSPPSLCGFCSALAPPVSGAIRVLGLSGQS